MNTWGYLILIAALFALASIMLYARFSSRSRAKLLHHSPGDVSLESFHRDEPLSVELDGDGFTEDPARREDTPMREDRKSISSISLDPIRTEPEKKEGEQHDAASDERQKEDAYLDELQEAAAGLAVLMRSSPVQDRSGPVVFAPEDEESVDEESSGESPAAEISKEETILIPAIDTEDPPVEKSREATGSPHLPGDLDTDAAAAESGEFSDPGAGELMEEAASTSVGSESEGTEKPQVSLLEILGEEVVGKFSQIDDSLDALEDLVSGVERKLSDWNSDEPGALESVEPGVISVEEAA